ncbi:MAG: hypothetical protein JWN86_3878 [Planctomycetota bacterium]|nr:hypothetical protein [Planctomycetota bacterium]
MVVAVGQGLYFQKTTMNDPSPDPQPSSFKQIVRTLIEATPEWWTSATLELVAPPEGLGRGVSHLIYNPQHPRDIVVPTEDLMAATRELELASLAQGDSWRRCIFRITQEQDNWRFVAEFER